MLGTLGTSLLRNLFTVKAVKQSNIFGCGVTRSGEGTIRADEVTIRAGKGAIRSGQNF